MNSSLLELNNVSVILSGQKIVDDVSFDLKRGEALAIIGPNGSGKTTLLKAILGSISFKGEIKITPGVNIGYVPQKLDIERDLPITVSEFFLLHPVSKNKKVAISFQDALKIVDLPLSFLEKRLNKLSSGEFQRVLIAWAFLDTPDLLLFDEPTASVDISGQKTIYDILYRLQKIHNITLILISHDLSVVYRYAGKVLCLNHARVCFGPPREVLTPEELKMLYGGGKIFYKHINSYDNG